MATFHRCDRCKEEIKKDGAVGKTVYRAGSHLVTLVGAEIGDDGLIRDSKDYCRSCVVDIVEGRTGIVRAAPMEQSQ